MHAGAHNVVIRKGGGADRRILTAATPVPRSDKARKTRNENPGFRYPHLGP
jgi:hypothetical protein